MDETYSVLKARLVTCVSSGVALKGFHTVMELLELLKGKVFKYLALFLLWHPSDLH